MMNRGLGRFATFGRRGRFGVVFLWQVAVGCAPASQSGAPASELPSGPNCCESGSGPADGGPGVFDDGSLSVQRFGPIAFGDASTDDFAEGAVDAFDEPSADPSADATIDAGPDAQGEVGPAPVGDAQSCTPCPPWAFHTVCIDVSPSDWKLLHDNPEQDLEAQGTVALDGVAYRGVRVQIHGGYARTVAKKSYRFVLQDDEEGPDLFGVPGEHHRRFVLQASWIDPSFLRSWLVFDLLRGAGGLAPRIGFAVVHANGTRLGMYLVIERIDKPFLKRQGLNRGGNLYKAESNLADWKQKGDPLSGFEQEEGQGNPTDDLGTLLDVLNTTPTTARDFTERVEPVLSLRDYELYEQVHTFTNNVDAYSKNYYLYHDIAAQAGSDAARFRMVSWDADATFGRSWNGDDIDSEGPVRPGLVGPWVGWDAFGPRLFAIAEYREAYLTSYAQALAGPWQPEVLSSRVRAQAAAIRTEAVRDLAQWQPNRNFDDEIAYLLDSLGKRHTFMTGAVESSRAVSKP